MSWRTKGPGDDDVCLIAAGVANITHVSPPSNSHQLQPGLSTPSLVNFHHTKKRDV